MAKSIAALVELPAASDRGAARGVPMRQVFDSLLEPLPPAARRLAGADRQLVFESERCILHVRVEVRAGGSGFLVAGQLQDRSGAPMAGVPLCLLASAGASRFAVTSDEGEFDLAMDALGSSGLRFLVGNDQPLTVELPIE